jgi:hypothetical protein
MKLFSSWPTRLALVAALAVVAATAGVTPAQAATVSPPQPVPGTQILQGVACPIGNTCFAVGFSVRRPRAKAW